MNTETLTMASPADGLTLRALLVAPDGRPRGLLQIAHGMAEHKERYLDFMRAMADAGWACLTPDHRGHGQSVKRAEDLGYFYENGDASLLADMRAWTRLFKDRFPDAPLCLFGHSMGSLAARACVRADDADVDALIVCGCPVSNPALGAGLVLAKTLRALRGERHRSKLIDNLMFGPYAKRFPGEERAFCWLNSDQEAVRRYEDDPACGYVFTINGHIALMNLMARAYAKDGWKVGKPELPILFISGGDDPCMVDVERLGAAAAHMKNVGYENVEMKVYEKLRHEILLEPERERVWADVLAFLNRLS